MLVDARTGDPVVPNGSLGHRFGDAGVGRWNLELGDVDPLALPAGRGRGVGAREAAALRHSRRRRRRPAARRALHDGSTVTSSRPSSTCCSRSTASGATGCRWLGRRREQGLRRRGVAVHPGLAGGDHRRPGCDRGPDRPRVRPERRGVARPLDDPDGGGHQPLVPLRHDLPCVPHARPTSPAARASTVAAGPTTSDRRRSARSRATPRSPTRCDWNRPPRNMIQTAYWYLHTDQFRYDPFGADTLSATDRQGAARRPKTTADVIAQSARMGWMPSYPTFNRNPLDAQRRRGRGRQTGGGVRRVAAQVGRARLRGRGPGRPRELPTDPVDLARPTCSARRARATSTSSKHLLGTDSSLRATESPEGQRPVDVKWRDQAPDGKLDLLLTLDFRQTSTTIFSDVVLPAATWYEKHDLNTTDMHPFVHSFNPAIAPPWQTRTDWDAWQTIAEKFSELAAIHLGSSQGRRGRAAHARHPGRDGEPARRGPRLEEGRVRARARSHRCPKLVEVERDYGAVAEKMNALGPLMDTLGATTKGVTFELGKQVDYLRAKNGAVRGGVADGRPSLKRDVHVCEAILAMSGTTQRPPGDAGLQDAGEAHRRPAGRPGGTSTRASRSRSPTRRARPVPVITSPEWSGSETGGRRYSPFTINVERRKPWHTLTGRMHFYLDHDWMTELGEGLPVYRPPLNMAALFAEPEARRSRRRVGSRWRGSRCVSSLRTTSGRSTRSTRTTCSCCRSRAAARTSG